MYTGKLTRFGILGIYGKSGMEFGFEEYVGKMICDIDTCAGKVSRIGNFDMHTGRKKRIRNVDREVFG